MKIAPQAQLLAAQIDAGPRPAADARLAARAFVQETAAGGAAPERPTAFKQVPPETAPDPSQRPPWPGSYLDLRV